ncbi:MAG TPA: hypothetical protein VNA28_14825 [Solirubrobacteraceae bacterium]|nr:hypothetical protein [Solirubrobacteraceae bacterium]
MTAFEEAEPDAGLDRLVAALVSWGATASQIVTHMERTRRSSGSCDYASTVDGFTALVRQLAGPVAAERGLALEPAAEAIEAIDEEVLEQVLLVAPPRSRAERRRRPG